MVKCLYRALKITGVEQPRLPLLNHCSNPNIITVLISNLFSCERAPISLGVLLLFLNGTRLARLKGTRRSHLTVTIHTRGRGRKCDWFHVTQCIVNINAYLPSFQDGMRFTFVLLKNIFGVKDSIAESAPERISILHVKILTLGCSIQYS